MPYNLRHRNKPPCGMFRGTRSAAKIAALLCGEVKHGAVGAVHMLRHVLEEQLVAGEVRLQRRAEEVAEDGDVERSRRRLAESRLQRSAFPRRQPCEAGFGGTYSE